MKNIEELYCVKNIMNWVWHLGIVLIIIPSILYFIIPNFYPWALIITGITLFIGFGYLEFVAHRRIQYLESKQNE